MSAVDLREQALAKFQEASAMQGEDGTVPAEKLDEYNATVEDAMRLDGEFAKATKAEGNSTTVRDRLDFYQGKATGQPMRWQETVLDPRAKQSIGEQFVGSDTYKELIESGRLSSPRASFKTDPVTFFTPQGGMRAAADDLIHTESGGSAAPQALRLPGIYAYGRPPLNVRGLFVNDTTTADSIEFVQQTGFDKATGLAVKQATADDDAAGLKKQSSVKWEVETAYAETIATWMATTRQALAQRDGVRSFIDNQGRLMLELEEEDQLVNGDGTRPNLSGILDQPEIQTDSPADNLDGVRHARTLVRTGSSRLAPTFVILNPEDSEEFDLLKDNEERYRGGNPIGNFAFDLPIWGLTRVESEALDPGTAIVGARPAATVFERQPITVLTADQHSDFFIRNLVVILFEERLAFPIYFPTAFVKMTLASWGS